MTANDTQQQPPEIDAAAKEARLLAARRSEIDGPCGVAAAGASDDGDSAMVDPVGPRRRWALALSGGGIRSATYSLGVMQWIAEQPAPGAQACRTDQPGAEFRQSLLSRFDYLSTVSGGGYLGSFVQSLFQAGRLDREPDRPAAPTSKAAAADRAVRVLKSGPPGRIRSTGGFREPDHTLKSGVPLAWLRESGRYLVPTGTGDAVYAAALAIRNWLAVHWVIGIVLLLLLGLVKALRAVAMPWTFEWEYGALTHAVIDGGFWWSPLFALALVPVLVWAVPSGIAYWFSYQLGKEGDAPLWNPVVVAAAVAAVLLFGVGLWIDPGQGTRHLLWVGGGALIALAIAFHTGTAMVAPTVGRRRVVLTRSLSVALLAVLALFALGAVDTAGQTLYVAWSGDGAGWVLTPAALLGAAVWVTRTAAAIVPRPSPTGRLARLPLTALAGIAGVVIFFMVAALWSFAVNWLMWDSGDRNVMHLFDASQTRTLWILLGMALVLAVITGQFPGFINLSSLQSFYSARIARAYLGASNGQRFGASPRNLSVSEPLPADALRLEDFYDAALDRLETLAPLHIVNVTLCKTVDPAEQLVQRDRKGQPLAVLPYGFAIDGRTHAYRQGEVASEVQRPLSLAEWVGTSGAAFTTGIGRETSLGMSLLMGSANVRLGTWWESGVGAEERVRSRVLHALYGGVRRLFTTQVYLSYELRARFFGTHRRWQYLTDGGHFENTALYELLRPTRDVGLVIACDNGADPDYGFGDLANLIRLARIDLHAEVSVVTAFDGHDELAAVFGTPADFTRAAADGPVRPRPRCALLLRVEHEGDPVPRWIVLLKPALMAQAPAEVRQYGADHPSFPNEPTSDQFFDEAQWESYRALGYANARSVLTPATFRALERYVAAQTPAGTASRVAEERAA